MSLSENIKNRREELKLSQEYVAEQLGLSRQAVSKWETGQSEPTASNLIQLAEVFEISLSELVDPQKFAEKQTVNQKKPNPILRTNLTRLAILCHAVFLNTSVVHIREFFDRPDETVYKGIITFDLIMLTICSIWMTSNHRFEPDKQQRRKNVNIELGYCAIMLLVALIDMYLKLGVIGIITFLPVIFVYILYINPKFMNRKLTR